MTDSGSRTYVDAMLDQVGGAIVGGELERLERLLFLDDWAAAKAQWGAEVTVEKLARTAPQRRADALVLMAQRSATNRSSDDGIPASNRPLFTVHLGYQALGRACELADRSALSPALLGPWLTKADIERVVFGPDGRILDLGRRSRFFRGGGRRAIEIRDRTCTHPSCQEPADRCDVDHIEPWAEGGPTDVANGRLRCGPHNRDGTAPPGKDPPDPPDP